MAEAAHPQASRMTLPSRIGGCAIHAGPTAHTAPGPSAVTLGRFDAVHVGHQALLTATIEAARALPQGQSVAITFWPPEWVLRPGAPRQLLTSLDDRLALLAAAGLDAIIVWPFDLDLAEHNPEQFLRCLRGRLRMHTLLTGPNARIGKDRAGTPEVMAAIARDLGFSYRSVAWRGTPGATASSGIRAALLSGDLDSVNASLGRLYSLVGEVVEGAARGSSIGFPTANLCPPDRLVLPADGVYAGLAAPAGHGAPTNLWRAVVNVGVRPTFGGDRRLVEAHLLGFEGHLYGRTLRLFFQTRLRNERRFASSAALAEAIRRDVEAARSLPSPDPCALHPLAGVGLA